MARFFDYSAPMSAADQSANLYAVLGVRPDSTDKEIKSAYRKLAFEHHPDRNEDSPDAADKLREVIEAYETLSDPDKRQAYDRARRGPAYDSGMRPEDFEQSKPPKDVVVPVVIDFAASVAGTECTVTYKRRRSCGACQGTGAISGAVETCGECKGVGKRRASPTRMVLCSYCSGKGVHIEDPCRACHGDGRVDGDEDRAVVIPAGIQNGEKVRVVGAGSVGSRGGAVGDLVVRVEVQPHAYYQRRGDDVVIKVPISYGQAVLGAQLAVPSPRGPAEVTVPAGTPSGRELRLKGQGIQRASGASGDLVVSVFIHVSESPQADERALVEQLEQFSQASAVAHPFLQQHWSSSAKD